MITPAITAIAKSANMVTIVTVTITKISSLGIRLKWPRLLQLKVAMETTNMIPTSAASGIKEI